MISSLLGKKIGMTQVYDAQNVLIPVTVVEAGPCSVVQVKTVETDGYHAVQIGFSTKKSKNASAAELAHAKKANLDNAPRVLSEVRLTEAPTLKVGDVVNTSIFAEGQLVDVIGITKGKGFQGVVKRFRVGGGPAAHGSMFHRRIGSVGASSFPSRTWPGHHMPGRMGAVLKTVQNLEVLKVDAEKNMIVIKGSVPGSDNSLLYIRRSLKKPQGIQVKITKKTVTKDPLKLSKQAAAGKGGAAKKK